MEYSPAVVAELVRASYLIDTLTDPKVEGSNPAVSRSIFEKRENMVGQELRMRGSK